MCIPYRGRFDGFHALPASVSKTCLVRFDNNRYSVSASAVGRPVDVHADADRIVIRQDGGVVAEIWTISKPKALALSKRFYVLLEKGETQMKVLAPYRIAVALRRFLRPACPGAYRRGNQDPARGSPSF
jgi:hypothetical protein